MGFTKDFESDPLGERVYIMLFGPPKIGKTRAILDLVRVHRNYVILFSLDKGTMAVRQEPKTYKGRLTIAYPDGLRACRADMKEARIILARLAKAGVPRSNIWVAFDTVTHLQSKLLAEARRINVTNPASKDTREEYIRDAVVETDWNINLAHMSEIADFLVNVKANVVITALDRPEKIKREETGRSIPALSGQSYARFVGDADAVLHVAKAKDGSRYVSVSSATAIAGDRSGYLADVEPLDLKAIQQKMIGVEPPLALPAPAASAVGPGAPPAGDDATPTKNDAGAGADEAPAPAHDQQQKEESAT